MVKQPTAEQTEFQMSSEDFPALPGTQLNDGIMSSASQQMNMNHATGMLNRIYKNRSIKNCLNIQFHFIENICSIFQI